jgi:hypothetical protein
MARVSNSKRIITEDFSSEDQAMIQKLAFSINPFFEEITNAFNKNINFDNLNQQYSFIELEVDSGGVPKVQSEIRYELKTKIKGCQVINAENLTDLTNLTGSPFITYEPTSNNTVKIKHVTGLPADKKFRLSVILIG